tara:strand:- start:195 stop:935 length:741 start_codon:yes stop_codon:yes gene_type:complete
VNYTSIETSQELEVRNAWEEFVKHFKLIFYNNLSKKDLSMSFSWELEYKAIGEIGGRLLEDFFVSKLEEENDKQDFIIFEPVHARALGDVKCIFKHDQKEFIFYIDIKCNYLRMRERTFEYYQKKGIKKKKPGQSHPNIMSVEKLKTFVEDEEHKNSDIAMLFIKYDIVKTNQSFEFKIDPQLEQKCLFLLRDIGDDYFDVGNLGKGQVQMSKLDRLEFKTRGKREFLEIVLQKRQKDRIKRPTKI